MRSQVRFLVLVLAAVPVLSCKDFLPIVKTVIDIAREACSAYAADTGVTVEEVCQTEEQLRPFVDAILSAREEAAAMRSGALKPPPCEPLAPSTPSIQAQDGGTP